MPPEIQLTVAVAVGLGIFTLVTALVAVRCRVKVPSGAALVIHRSSGQPRVSFSDAMVIPIVSRAELVDCTVHPVAIVRQGVDSLRCRDKLRVDVHAEFRVGVNRTEEDVLKVANSVGCARAGDPETLRNLFEARFVDALATVIGHLGFDDLLSHREQLRDEVLQVVGTDLGGYVVVELALTRLEQVPIELLDPNNTHDAEAIRRISERVAEEKRRQQEIELEMRRQAAIQEVQVREVELEVERRMEKLRS